MADDFTSVELTLASPAVNAVAVTPNDTTDLTHDTRALYVGGAGDIKLDTVGGDSGILFKNVIGLLPVRVRRVWATSTTATYIIALR
jgi:hypothetical protein